MKIGDWTIDDKSQPGRIFMRHAGRPPMTGEVLPEDQVPAKAGQFDLGNGLTLKIIELNSDGWYCIDNVFNGIEAALKAYQAAGGKLPTPAFATD